MLILLLWVLLQTTFFQNFLVHRITHKLSKDLNTTVSIKHVNFELFDRMVLEKMLVLDHKNDTLLYARSLRVGITDWFFLKDNIDIKYVGLEDAVIKLNRKTPEWNYQFLADYFGGSSSTSTKESKPINLNLKIISLKNVSVYQQDFWTGRDQYVSVKNMRLEAEKLDLANHSFQINQVQLDDPVFAQYDYTGLRPPRKDTTSSISDTITVNEPWNADNWKLTARKITITNGKVAVERQSTAPSVIHEFDDKHIILSQLNATIHNTRLDGDTLQADVNFSVKDRGGFTIKKFNSKFKMTPELMEFSKLDIQTEKSRLGNYFAMHYHSFNDDMNDFIHAVKMEGRFKNAQIDSDDLAYFAPETRSWNKDFIVNGNASGKVDNLTAMNFSVKAGDKNFLSGDLSIRGLPDVDAAFMDLRIREMHTTYSELSSLIPALSETKQVNLAAFGHISYTGSFTGYFNDFVTFGNLTTDIGVLTSDLHLKVGGDKIPVYKGSLATANFDLGKFIRNKTLGNIAFDGSLNGSGFSEKNLNISIDGNIRKIEYNNYAYSDITAHGDIKKDVFSGSASVGDPNARIDTLVGIINFSKKNPFFNFNADVLTLNLKKLGFTSDDISLAGRFKFDFKGSNIDDFLGTAQVTDAMLTDKGKRLSFDSLVINSTRFNSSKLLSLRTNELEATINGDFRIMQLPKAFQLFLNKYYPAYITKPEGQISNQDFSFMVHARNVSDYVSLFDRRISGLNETLLQGSINVEKNLLSVEGSIPEFKYTNVSLNDIRLNAEGTRDTLTFNMNIDDVIINDSLHSPKTVLSIVANNDNSDINITTAASKTLNSADLSARINTKADGFSLVFNPSTFTLNQKKWTIVKDGEIQLIGEMLTAHQLRLFQNGQEITVNTKPSDIGNSNDIYINLKNVIVSDITPLFFKSPKIDGMLSGTALITDPYKNPFIHFNTTLDRFYFEGDSIGILKATGNYSSSSGGLNTSIISDNEPYNFTGSFAYNPNDTLSPISGNVDFKNSQIHILEPYLSGIVSNIQGRTSGRLDFSGKTNHPVITGQLRLDSTSMTVDYTQCRYTLANDSKITFNPDELDFGTITLLDSKGKTATLSGKMYHNFFDNFFFNDFHVKANNGFLLLNTTAKDNKEFYGNVRGQAELSLNGFTSDMRMSIKGRATDSSHIYLPIDETAESGSLNYIEFLQFGREMKVDNSVRQNTNIKVDMELTATPLVNIDVILDETTGDVIKARGNGKLFITAGTSDPLTIRGRYNVEEGEYTFNFQTISKTPFTLQQGYIEWQGDPYLALLNIDAIYRASNVSLDNIPTSTGMSNTQGDIDIIFKLRGTLKDPAPSFAFQFPFDNPLKSDPIANEYLKSRFQSDNNQLLNQVASLLLFNTFLTTDQGLITGNTAGNFVTKTVGQLLSATLTNSLNSWLKKLIKTNSVNLYTNITASDFNFQKALTERQIQNFGDFGFRTALLHNKLMINIGGNIDLTSNPGLANSNTNVLFTPDVSFEYLISPSGNLRVVGFNRSDAGLGNIAGITRRNRTGIQLSYRRDFDSFEEFFTGKKNRK